MLNNALPDVNWSFIATKMVSVTAGLVGTVVVLVAGRWLLRFLLRQVFEPMIRRERSANPQRAARLATLETVSRSLMMYALYFVVLCILMYSVGLNPTSLIATAGVAGVALGFGAQKLVRDVVTGFLLILEDQFSVGDLVNIGGNTGIVVETGMRVTKLRDESGRLIILSNGDIIQVINYSKGEFRVTVDVAVSSESDARAVEEAVRAAGERLSAQNSSAGKPELRGITAMSAASATYRIEAVVPPVQRERGETELRSALRTALEERGVKLA